MRKDKNGKKRICFLAQFPPPMHGLSKAVETLYTSALTEQYAFSRIDLTNNRRFLQTLWRVLRADAEAFYFTISQTRGGNLRDLVLLWLLRHRRGRVLVHLHGGFYRTLVEEGMPAWQKKANFRAMKHVSGAIVLSDSLRWIFRGMVPQERIFTVPNCVDDEYLMPRASFEEKMRRTHTVAQVLYLSNFIREKGYPEVLQMAVLEKQRCDGGGARQMHFHFAGKFFSEEDRQAFLSAIEQQGLDPYVTWHGVVGGDEKRALLDGCDFFTLLTRYPNEGQPISILEAMGNGAVIVTTDHAGIPDLVRPGENGLVFGKDAVDPQEVYDAMCTLWADPAGMAGIRRTNREAVESRYTEANYLLGMRRCFDEVMPSEE